MTSEGAIYPLLRRLRRDGRVDSAWRESPQGPPRRYYSLTTEGTAALKAFAGQWATFRDTVLIGPGELSALSPRPAAVRVLTVLGWLAGLGAIVYLWQRGSTAFIKTRFR